MDGLEVLRERVQALLKSYAALQRDRERLRKEAEALRAEREVLQARLHHAEESLLAVRIGKSISDEPTRAQSRKKLDEVIGEIDKILTTLND